MSVSFAYSSAKVPPIPVAPLTLKSPDGSKSISGLTGHLDTAADRTVVLLPIIQQLGLRPVTQVQAKGFGTAAMAIDVYRLQVEIAGVGAVTVDALGHSTEPHILIGRDFLNLFRVTFDGPNNVVEFH